MFDPDGVVDMTLHSLSSPDLNVLNGLFSLQGYSSIVYGPYAKATGSHAANGMGNNALSPSAVGSGLLDQLDATTLVTSPSYLVRPASAAAAAGTTPVNADSPHGPGARSWCRGRGHVGLRRDHRRLHYFAPLAPDGDSIVDRIMAGRS